MSIQDAYEDSVLDAILNGVAIPNLLDNAASSPATNLYLALHTADPGEVGAAQTTSEADYPGYARVAVARSSGSPAWTITGSSPTSATCGQQVFPASSGAGTALTHWSLGTAASGTGAIIFIGALADTITIPSSPPSPPMSPTMTPTIQLD